MPRPEMLRKVAEEESSYIIRNTFTDESGDDVIPVSLYWDLTSVGGTVINSRLNQQVVTPAAITNVVLQGADLQILDGEESYAERIFTARATYNSTLGNGLPLNKFVRFKVRNLRLIAYPLDIDIYDPVFVWEDRDVGVV